MCGLGVDIEFISHGSCNKRERILGLFFTMQVISLLHVIVAKDTVVLVLLLHEMTRSPLLREWYLKIDHEKYVDDGIIVKNMRSVNSFSGHNRVRHYCILIKCGESGSI